MDCFIEIEGIYRIDIVECDEFFIDEIRHADEVVCDIDGKNHVLFFFSSRRRHTRSYGDWSSDVCSSDLVGLAGFRKRLLVELADTRPAGKLKLNEEGRSEERRVGKECRSRWLAYH